MPRSPGEGRRGLLASSHLASDHFPGPGPGEGVCPEAPLCPRRFISAFLQLCIGRFNRWLQSRRHVQSCRVHVPAQGLAGSCGRRSLPGVFLSKWALPPGAAQQGTVSFPGDPPVSAATCSQSHGLGREHRDAAESLARRPRGRRCSNKGLPARLPRAPPAPSAASGLASRAARCLRLCVSLCVCRSRAGVSVFSCRSLCVCHVVLFCLSLCPLSCLVGSVFQKKIVGMALTKRTVQSLPVSA